MDDDEVRFFAKCFAQRYRCAGGLKAKILVDFLVLSIASIFGQLLCDGDDGLVSFFAVFSGGAHGLWRSEAVFRDSFDDLLGGRPAGFGEDQGEPIALSPSDFLPIREDLELAPASTSDTGFGP